jgi:hypothetical protein
MSLPQGTGLPFEGQAQSRCAETPIMNSFPWGTEWRWRLTEGAAFKTIKSIWYGLFRCFEIFERDIMWLQEGTAGWGSIYTVKRVP